MAVPQFPSRANGDYPDEPQGPPHLVLVDLPPEWPSLSVKTFKDGGVTLGLQNTNFILKWDLTYGGLSPSDDSFDPSMLDDHRFLAQSEFGGFDFRHPRTQIKYSNVHYETFENPGHANFGIQARHIVLIKRPPYSELEYLLLEDGNQLLTERGLRFLLQN